MDNPRLPHVVPCPDQLPLSHVGSSGCLCQPNWPEHARRKRRHVLPVASGNRQGRGRRRRNLRSITYYSGDKRSADPQEERQRRSGLPSSSLSARTRRKQRRQLKNGSFGSSKGSSSSPPPTTTVRHPTTRTILHQSSTPTVAPTT